MTITLAVTPRDESTSVQDLRADGQVPAVIYGPKHDATPVAVSGKEFEKLRREAGESTIIEVSGLTEPIEVLIKDVEFNPVRQAVDHIDLYAIERGKDMTVNVPIHFIGEAPVEHSNEGSVTKVLHEISVTCRPSKLPSHIDVDISVLKSVEDKILIQDLSLGDDVTVEAEPEDPIAVVSAAKQEAADDEADSASVDMDSIEVEQKGKGEDGAADTVE